MTGQPARPSGQRLFERERALRHLDEAVETALGGAGSALLFEGPAGIGKTALLREAESCALDKGLRILGARATESESSFGWGVVTAMFRPAVRAAPPEQVFDGAAGLARSLFEPPASPAAPFPDPFPLLHGLYWLTVNLAERTPLAMIVDDAQWSDPESLQFLHYLLGRVEGVPLALFISAREREPVPAATTDLIARLGERDRVTAIAVGPLRDDSIKALIERQLPGADDAFCAAVAAEVAGNPFHALGVCEGVRAANLEPVAANVDRLPALHSEGLREAITARIAKLGDHAVRLARAVALLSGSITVDRAGKLAGLDEGQAARALHTLTVADVLTPGHRVTFTHPIVADVVLAGLDPELRSAEHLRAARLLRAEGAAPDEVARQLLAAEPSGEPWAYAVLREAGRIALARGAAPSAAELLRRAHQEAPDGAADMELLLELGRIEVALGEPSAFGRLEAARELATDPVQKAAAATTIGLAHYVTGRPVAAASEIRTALDAMPPGHGGVMEGELVATYCVAARGVRELLEPLRRFLQTPRPDPEGCVGPADHARLASLAFDAMTRGDTVTAEAAVREAMRADQSRMSVYAVMTLTVALLYLDHAEESRRLAEPISAEARSRGDRLLTAVAAERIIYAHWLSGDVSAAVAVGETAVEISEGRWDQGAIPTRAVLAMALFEHGEDADAARMIDVPAELEARLGHAWSTFELPWARAQLALGSGDLERALAQAELLGERLLALEITNPAFKPWRSFAALTRHGLGDTERAIALAQEDLELARAARSAMAIGVAQRALGTMTGGPKGIERLEDAVSQLDRAGTRLEAARARVALGRAMREAQRTEDAKRVLAEAIELAGSLGAVRTADEALSELRAAGGKPRRLTFTGAGSLTPGQRRVADLAAAGATNREIAETLFLTVHTVEAHLTSAYTKLGITSRTELPGALGAGGRSSVAASA